MATSAGHTFRDEILRLAQVSLSYSDDDREHVAQIVVAIDAHLKQKARQLLLNAAASPVMLCYSNDATSFLVRSQSSCKAEGHESVQRRGRKLQEFLCQKAVLKNRRYNETRMAILQGIPRPLDLGKKADNIASASFDFWSCPRALGLVVLAGVRRGGL